MAKATDLKVQIKFEATGDKELARAFTKAATAQKKLEDVTKKLARAQKKLNKRTFFGIRNTRLLGKSASKTGNAFATIRSKLLLASFAFNLVNRSLGVAVRAFMKQEEAVAKLNSTLVSTRGASKVSSIALQGVASKMQKLTGIGDETILSMQGVLLTFTQIKGKIFQDATEAILDISVALGQDLQQTAIQVGKALNDPLIGVTALGRVGIQFTDTQKAMIKNFTKTNQIVKAQKIILEELNLQFGGTAENVDSTSIAFKRLSSAFGDLMESGGGTFAPLLKNMANILTAAIEIANNTDEANFKEFFSELDTSSQKMVAFGSNFNKLFTDIIIADLERIGVATQDDSFAGWIKRIQSAGGMGITNFFPDESFVNFKKFEELIKNKPFEAIDLLQNEIREINKSSEPITLMDDLVKSFEGQDLKKLLIEGGFFGQGPIVPDDLEFSNRVNELKEYFEGILKGGLTKEEIEKGFDGKDFPALLKEAIETKMTHDGTDFNPFANILEPLFSQDVIMGENAGLLQALNNLIAKIRKYSHEAGIGEEKTKSLVEKMSDFKKESEDSRKGFDDMLGATMQFTKGNKELTISLLKMRQALAIGNMILAFTEFMANKQYGKAFSAFAAGMTKIAQFKSQIDSAKSAALGTDFIAGSPQYIKVGDNPQMRERVTVTPLGSPNVRGGGSASGVVINLNGNILGTEEFVRDTLIPQLENSLGRNLA